MLAIKEEGGIQVPKPSKEDTVSLHGCTSESINYTLECMSCRTEGKRRIYWGESARSAFQRGREHSRDIGSGLKNHPLVIRFEEEHDGVAQDYLFRIISKHYSPLERQITESVLIEEVASSTEECLNLKSEWEGSKLPALLVTRPKGTSNKGVQEEGDKRQRESQGDEEKLADDR